MRPLFYSQNEGLKAFDFAGTPLCRSRPNDNTAVFSSLIFYTLFNHSLKFIVGLLLFEFVQTMHSFYIVWQARRALIAGAP